MRFELRAVESLPPLAWCARLRRGEEAVAVWHGPWVEVFADGFAEGAWDGSFAEGRFEDAVTFTGTGGRARPDHFLFASATNSQERLHLLRRGEELFVSNSLPFALVAGDDAPDPRFVWYEDEYVEQGRLGIFRERRSLPTRRGRMLLHECADLAVTRDLEVTRIEKPAPPEPRDYAGYVALIEGATAAVFANAADPARCRTYRPIATLSSGYDSNALAVLAHRHGCREAATFAEEEPGVAAQDDGSAIGEILGYGVKTYARRTRTQRRPWPEAEFCVCPPGGDRSWLAAEDELSARIFLSGRHGDIVLSGKQKPHAYTLARSGFDDLGGATMNEYRLRLGYLNFAPWFTGWQHADALRRIARCDEMRPWSIGGSYDRPVARRILEEAGVPRELFGQHKRGGAYEYVKQPGDLCESSRLDYLDFVRSLGLPRGWLRRVRFLKGLERAERHAGRRVHTWSGGRVSLPRLVPRRYRVGPQQGLLFHWGFERMKSRYQVP